MTDKKKTVSTEDIEKYINCVQKMLNARREGNDKFDHVTWGTEANDLARRIGAKLSPYDPSEWPTVWVFNPVLGDDSHVLGKLEDCIKEGKVLLATQVDKLDSVPSLKNLENAVACSEVGGIIHRRSDNIARTLRSRRYPVVTEGGKTYCDAEDAAVVWPVWKKHLEKEKQESGEF